MTSSIKTVWLYSDAHGAMAEASQAAIETAKRHKASLTVLSVFETSEDPLLQTPLGRDVARLLREDKEQRLRKLEEEARRELPVESITRNLLEGQVAWHTLTAHAVKHHPELLVVPADGGASAGPFGTLSMHLFRKCPSPVWSIQPGASGFPTRVLVAVNSGAKGSDERLLSQEVLRVAMRFATATGVELHLGHAWSLFHEDLIASRYGVKGTEPYLDLQLRYARDFTEDLVQETASREKLKAIHYPKGEPGKTIPALADEVGADLVVMGSAARRGLEGFLIGSVAETILNRMRRSAMVVKRPGFTSPVRGR